MRLCTICARGGSKGVPGKNTKMIAGAPLISHTVKRGIESNLFSHVAVSSDDQSILDIAAKAGADILIKRPSEMATDSAPKIPTIRHCVTMAEVEIGQQATQVFDLDATSPLRNVGDLEAVLNLLQQGNTSNVITAAPARHSPYFNMVELTENMKPVLSKPLEDSISCRQDSPKCYDMNGSIYAWHRSELFDMETLFGPRTELYVMPDERSIDIDSPLDFKIVEMLLEEKSASGSI